MAPKSGRGRADKATQNEMTRPKRSSSRTHDVVNRPASPLVVFLLTAVAATVVSWLLLDLPSPESELPWAGLVRDVVFERQAVDAALGLADAPQDHARTPGAIVLLMPLALVPAEFLTSFITIASVLSVASIAAGAVRLRRPKVLAGMALAVGLPVSVAFIQAVFHGSTFLPFAACLVWMWVFIGEGRGVGSGLFLALAGVSRLWPFLLLVVLMRYRQRAALITALVATMALTVGGLLLPGITLGGSLATLVGGGQSWISADHNGSLASWLVAAGPMAGAVLGMALVLGVWYLGLRRSRSLDSDIAWTLPAAVLASPLAWLPYLLVLTPSALVRSKSLLSMALASGIVLLQLVAYRLVSQQTAMTLTILLVWALCWSEGLHDPGRRRPMTDQANEWNPLKDRSAPPISSPSR